MLVLIQNNRVDDLAVRLYLEEVGQVKPLKPEAERKLVTRIKRGDLRAREEIIKSNLPKVVEVAHEYEGQGIPLLDLITEGNLGLIRAVEEFDSTKGISFGAHNMRWIRRSMQEALPSNRRKSTGNASLSGKHFAAIRSN